MLIDPAYGSSNFAVLVCQFVRNKENNRKQIQILYADQLERPTYEESIDHIFRLRKKYGNIQNIGIDSSTPELVSSIKKKIDERYDYQYVKDKMQ